MTFSEAQQKLQRLSKGTDYCLRFDFYFGEETYTVYIEEVGYENGVSWENAIDKMEKSIVDCTSKERLASMPERVY